MPGDATPSRIRGAVCWLACGLAMPAAAAFATAPAMERVIYKEAAGQVLHLFIHRPPEWRTEDHRPALLMIHGGGWVGGGVRVFDPYAAYFSARGLICVVMEYRLLDRARLDPPLVCIQDAKSAMRWVRAHASELGIDPERIGAMGASAGGQLAAFLGTMDGCDDPADDRSIPARAQAMLLLNPVLHNGPGPLSYGAKRTGADYRLYSPFHNVTPDDAPALVCVGSEDRLVPVAMIEAFAAEMTAAGVRCTVRIYPGQAHSFFAPANAGGKYLRLTLAAQDEFLTQLGWLAPAAN